ncbi:hypothetical protein [Pontibacter litorisediminis]|uniref:hypothetical protein n=1 Tax=Pontibacter litorisediminis TaxID=1846260 RepID=UPI0023EBECA7|nr:hypothetical protein [Pontibacter litorisediminis]
MFESITSGSLLFEHLGASTRWLYYFLQSELTGSRRRKYSEFYDGRRNWRFSRKTKNAIYNNFVGLISLIAVLRLLLFLSEMF